MDKETTLVKQEEKKTFDEPTPSKTFGEIYIADRNGEPSSILKYHYFHKLLHAGLIEKMLDKKESMSFIQHFVLTYSSLDMDDFEVIRKYHQNTSKNN